MPVLRKNEDSQTKSPSQEKDFMPESGEKSAFKLDKKTVNDSSLNNTESLITDATTPFSVTEAFKSLRTNIMFSLPDSGSKIIGVTSGEKGDGKSFVLLNTAISFSELDKRCVVVDCDLRLPSIANKLGLPNIPGLTDLIVGNCESKEATHKDVHKIDVITAGTIPGDSTGIISSKRMRIFFNKLKNTYDYIFVDLPPVTSVTDAVLLSDVVDGFLLVVRHDKTENKNIQEMLRLMKMANSRILGFVYNDDIISAKGNYYKYYK